MIRIAVKNPYQPMHMEEVFPADDSEIFIIGLEHLLAQGEAIEQMQESENVVCFYAQKDASAEPCIELPHSKGCVIWGKVAFVQTDDNHIPIDMDDDCFEMLYEKYDITFFSKEALATIDIIKQALKEEENTNAKDPYLEFIDQIESEFGQKEDLHTQYLTMCNMKSKEKTILVNTSCADVFTILRKINNADTQLFIMSKYYNLKDLHGSLVLFIKHLHLMFCDRGWIPNGLHT